MEGVTVAARRGLLDELKATGVITGGVGVGILIAGRDDDADLFDPAAHGFFDQDLEGGLLFAVAVDEGLKRDRALILAGGSDDRLADLHGRSICAGRDLGNGEK